MMIFGIFITVVISPGCSLRLFSYGLPPWLPIALISTSLADMHADVRPPRSTAAIPRMILSKQYRKKADHKANHHYDLLNYFKILLSHIIDLYYTVLFKVVHENEPCFVATFGLDEIIHICLKYP